MAGLISATWNRDRSVTLLVIEPDGSKARVTIPGTIFAGINFDADPRLWAQQAEAAIYAWRPALIDYVYVLPVSRRDIVDNGGTDVSVVIDWYAGISCKGTYDGR